MRAARRACRRDQRGSVSAFVVVFIGLLTAAAALAEVVSGLVVGDRRVEAAADLAALAGAAAGQQGALPCPAAADVAGANGARLLSCDQLGEDVVVEVAKDVSTVLGRTWTLTAHARAGPGVRLPPARQSRSDPIPDQ